MIGTFIGSRSTDDFYLELIRQLAYAAAERNHIVRSGHADGCDLAAEKGVLDYFIDNEKPVTNLEVYLPWEGFNKYIDEELRTVLGTELTYLISIQKVTKNPNHGIQFGEPKEVLTYLDTYEDAKELMAKIHPNIGALSIGGQALHTRNIYQILGVNMKTPSDYVVCYAEPKFITKERVPNVVNEETHVKKLLSQLRSRRWDNLEEKKKNLGYIHNGYDRDPNEESFIAPKEILENNYLNKNGEVRQEYLTVIPRNKVNGILMPRDKIEIKGGTRTAVTLANRLNIPVFNLYFEEDREKIVKLLLDGIFEYNEEEDS